MGHQPSQTPPAVTGTITEILDRDSHLLIWMQDERPGAFPPMTAATACLVPIKPTNWPLRLGDRMTVVWEARYARWTPVWEADRDRQCLRGLWRMIGEDDSIPLAVGVVK